MFFIISFAFATTEVKVSKFPSKATAYFERAKKEFSIGLIKNCINDLNKAIKEYPDLYEAHLFLAKIYYNSGDFEKAEFYLLPLQKLSPINNEAVFLYGMTKLQKGDTNGLNILRKIYSDYPPAAKYYTLLKNKFSISAKKKENTHISPLLSQDDYDKLLDKARKNFNDKNFARSKVFFDILSSTLPPSIKRPAPLKELLFFSGKCAYNLKQYADAIRLLKKATNTKFDYDIFCMLSDIYLSEKNWEQAAYYLEKAIDLSKDNIKLREKLVDAYTKLNFPLKKIDQLLFITEHDSKNVIALYNLAYTLYSIGRFSEALEYVKKIKLILPPGNKVYFQTKILERKLKLCIKNH